MSPTRRLKAHHKTITSLFPGVCGQNGTRRMFFSWRWKVVVDRSSFSCVGSLLHARGAATEKALSPIHRHVHGTTRSPDNESRSADHAGRSLTNVNKSNRYSGIPRQSQTSIQDMVPWSNSSLHIRTGISVSSIISCKAHQCDQHTQIDDTISVAPRPT